MMAVSFTNREKITIKQVVVNMMDKLNCFFRSLYDTESKNGKKLREFSMIIMRLGIWMITYGSFSVLFGGFLGFDFNTDVIAKMTVITGVGGVVFLIGLFITFIFKKDGSIYDGKTIKQNNKGE
ncbi:MULTISPECIES: hypothetical protein [Enterobacteriaceae]|nr:MULTISPECIES: hypothetical protein [Enterobacteriaceae]EIK4504325.1 hypothetical protein [Salmonella enterica subsp. enterica serovar Johannesburg]EJQ7169362.1 hypothetical protein [Salmonella enterica]EKD6360468.1 hypothetical protein [Salmonella enterica subsp. enterica serovar Infantis]ELK9735958.1 hypothetical protein [Salmonella enterica]ELL0496936.1 hypothetical protein [Salmonella enterica]